MRRWLPSISWVIVGLCLCVGVMMGAGGYTFYYANGASYLSNNPEACINCHVMNEYYDGWLKSSHHHVAVCNDCHVPHDLAGKYVAKADAGFRHSWAFTFEDFHEPIEMIDRSKTHVLNNCVRCHEMTVDAQMMTAHALGETANCLNCHRSVGHGPTK